MKKDTLISLFKNNRGLLRSKDFNYQGVVYDLLDKMIEAGKVIKLKNGLYCHTAYCDIDDHELLCMMYPKGVICLTSAWFYYELSTTIPAETHLAFPRNYTPAKIEHPPVKVYFLSEKYYRLGIKQKKGFKIYDVEKSVCDAVKYRNKVGEEITYEVLKNYMKLKSRNIEKLMNYAQTMRIENVITPMLKPLL